MSEQVVSLCRYCGFTDSLLCDLDDHIAGAEEVAACVGYAGHVHLDCAVPGWSDRDGYPIVWKCKLTSSPSHPVPMLPLCPSYLLLPLEQSLIWAQTGQRKLLLQPIRQQQQHPRRLHRHPSLARAKFHLLAMGCCFCLLDRRSGFLGLDDGYGCSGE